MTVCVAIDLVLAARGIEVELPASAGRVGAVGEPAAIERRLDARSPRSAVEATLFAPRAVDVIVAPPLGARNACATATCARRSTRARSCRTAGGRSIARF